MKNICFMFVLSFLISCFIESGVSAEEIDRIEGRIGLGAVFINSGNNLNPQGSKKYLDDLDSAADMVSSVIALVLPSLTYDVGDAGGLKLFVNTEPPIDEVGGFAFNLGGTYPLEGIGILEVSAFFTPFDEAWENPYVVGVSRKSTSTSKYGAKMAFNRIMGTGLRANLVYMNDDVDEDEIGDLIPELRRDGAVYALNVNYSFYPSKNLEIRPRFGIRKGSYDGDSNSFTKYKVDLEGRYRTGRLMIMPRIFYSKSDYDEVNPIFNRTRENDGFGLSMMANYFAPFGWQNWSALGLISYSIGDSNITFYDTESISVGLFMSYNF